jgi:hypothetical protein
MKKLLSILLIISTTTFGQNSNYVSVGVQGGGGSFILGSMCDNLDLSFQGWIKFSNIDFKTISFHTGYEIGEKISITPGISANVLLYNDDTKYDADETGFAAVEKKAKYGTGYTMELAWNFHDGDAAAGRISIKAVYLDKKVQKGIFMRFYF